MSMLQNSLPPWLVRRLRSLSTNQYLDLRWLELRKHAINSISTLDRALE